jgi:hypothetical protein
VAVANGGVVSALVSRAFAFRLSERKIQHVLNIHYSNFLATDEEWSTDLCEYVMLMGKKRGYRNNT